MQHGTSACAVQERKSLMEGKSEVPVFKKAFLFDIHALKVKRIYFTKIPQ